MKEPASEIRWYERDLRDLGRLARVVVLLIKILVCTSIVYELVAGATVWQAREGKTKHFVYPVFGLSMYDTIEELILRCGAFVVADRSLIPAQRDIVLFVDPRGGWDIKRISWLSQDGRQMRVQSDNYKQTGADSQTEPALATLQTSSVCGVVTDVVTVQRLLRSLTIHGRNENWLRLHYRERAQWDPTGKFAVLVEPGQGLLVFSCQTETPKLLVTDSRYAMKDSGGGIVFRNGKAIWPIRSAWNYAAFELESRRLETFHAKSSTVSELGQIDSYTVVLVGDATDLVHPGDTYKGKVVVSVKYPFPCNQFNGPSDLVHTKVVLR